MRGSGSDMTRSDCYQSAGRLFRGRVSLKTSFKLGQIFDGDSYLRGKVSHLRNSLFRVLNAACRGQAYSVQDRRVQASMEIFQEHDIRLVEVVLHVCERMAIGR